MLFNEYWLYVGLDCYFRLYKSYAWTLVAILPRFIPEVFDVDNEFVVLFVVLFKLSVTLLIMEVDVTSTESVSLILYAFSLVIEEVVSKLEST